MAPLALGRVRLRNVPQASGVCSPMKTTRLFLALLPLAFGALAQTPPAPAAPAQPVSLPPALAYPTQALQLDSAILHETRRINIYTPPGYAHGTSSYPVLYMPDGGLAEDFPHVSATIHKLIAEGAIPPYLVVGIENTERRRDLTGPTENEKDKTIAKRVGGSAAFRAFVKDELIPEIGKRYRTTGERAIVGESLAGLFIVEALFLDPDLFDTYIALSPSLWWNDGKLALGAKDWFKAHPGLRKTLYLTSAGDDILEGIEMLGVALRTDAPSGLRWIYEPRPQEHHSTIFLASEEAAYRQVLGVKAEAPEGK